MKVLVCGGRDYTDAQLIHDQLSNYHDLLGFSHVIHGGATGADSIAGEWAIQHGVQPVACKALWDYYRKQGKYKIAGFVRNKAMLGLGPELVLAFPGGPGTASMIDLASKAGIRVERIGS